VHDSSFDLRMRLSVVFWRQPHIDDKVAAFTVAKRKSDVSGSDRTGFVDAKANGTTRTAAVGAEAGDALDKDW